jgi:UDP-GlcNAc:undecaprenyl-phosphate GlcNAc-1-phosphate transferase
MFENLHYQLRLYIRAGATAFVLAAVLTPILIFILRRLNVMDDVIKGKLHDRPVPRGGGIAIFVAFAVAVLLPNYRDNPMKGVMLGSFICMVVGAIDDFRGVSAVIKLLTLFGVTLVMSYFGVRVTLTGYAVPDLGITLLWIVGVTSAINGIDNMDGLASGISAIVSMMFLAIAVEAFYVAGTEHSLTWFGLLAAGLLGANLGFLIFNFRPAHIFMGDAGSFFLGFTLAALGVMGQWNDNRIIAATIPVLILGVPIADFAYIIVARVLRGETRSLRSIIEHCALDHLSHRLIWIGFTQRKAVLFIYLICLALGVTGILLRSANTLGATVLALLQGLAILTIVGVLMAAVKNRHLCMMQQEIARLKGEPFDPREQEDMLR